MYPCLKKIEYVEGAREVRIFSVYRYQLVMICVIIDHRYGKGCIQSVWY